MNTCAALERFDKVRRPGVKKQSSTGKTVNLGFVDHIQACTTYAGFEFEALLSEPPDEWAERVVVARNQLAHHDDPFRATGQVGEYVLAEQLFWLFAMCMLRTSAAPAESFEGIVAQSRMRWLPT